MFNTKIRARELKHNQRFKFLRDDNVFVALSHLATNTLYYKYEKSHLDKEIYKILDYDVLIEQPHEMVS